MDLTRHFTEEWRLIWESEGGSEAKQSVTAGAVVLVGRQSDEHLGAISSELQRRNIPVARIAIDQPASLPDQVISTEVFQLEECPAVVCREIAAPLPLPHHADRAASTTWHEVEQFREFAARETAAATLGWLTGLATQVWINEPFAAAQASNKVVQLRVAARCGLRIPQTLVTASSESAKHTVMEIETAVYKSLSDPIVWVADESAGFLHTSEVTLEHLSLLNEVHFPVLLQERLKIHSELRITIVGEQCFPVRITAPDDYVDWRRHLPSKSLRYEVCDIDPQLKAKLIRLMQELKLTFAAVDIAETGSGPMFLEVNPPAAYLWLEKGLGLSVTDAICDLCEQGRD